MAKKQKLYYYVLVFTSHGAVYVTDEPERHWCEWNYKEAPKEYGSIEYATDVARGLTWNCHPAVVVALPWEVTGQPYVEGYYEELTERYEKHDED